MKKVAAAEAANKPKEAKVKSAPVGKKKMSFKERQEFDGLESEMAKLETEKSTLTEVLSQPDASSEDLMKAGDRLSTVVSELEEKEFRWLELSEYE